jgi:guanylate kinase
MYPVTINIIRTSISGATLANTDIYHRQDYPLLIVISGPSGVGKDTIARKLLASRNSFAFVVTATTRPPRTGEVHGRDYFFVSKDEFKQLILEDELLEHAVVYGQYKGVPKDQIRKAIQSGRDVIMRVDVQGAATIKKILPDAIFIFLVAESEEELVLRLKRRRSETVEAMDLRIATAKAEMARIEEFDYWVVNTAGRIDDTVRLILSIVDAEHHRIGRRPIIL